MFAVSLGGCCGSWCLLRILVFTVLLVFDEGVGGFLGSWYLL